MNKRAKKLQLNRESLTRMDLGHAVGAKTAEETNCIACNTIDRTACITNCATCGNTNYITCLC